MRLNEPAAAPRRRSRPAVLALLIFTGAPAPAAFGIDPVTLAPLSISASTGEKPQSKVWLHAGSAWAVLPSSAAGGTWIWRSETSGAWTPVLRLSTRTGTKADVRARGDVVHVLLCGVSGSRCDGSPELVSAEYVPGAHAYTAWPARPSATSVSLPDNEAATLEIDTSERLWITTTAGSEVRVLYADPPYGAFSSPIQLNPGDPIDGDDISLVTALAGGRIGVLWSNQNRERFGFRVHEDGTDPTLWSADEIPAAQSALNQGGGMADDHLNVALASDGTLYAAVKTSYDTPGHPKVALLVRRPGGSWDDLYYVDDTGTRPIVLLNEAAGRLSFIYTSIDGGGDILLRESPLAEIAFGPASEILSGSLDDATSTRQTWTDSVVVIASGGGQARGVRLLSDLPAACADADSDGDGACDTEDDCILVFDPDQRDSDRDGYGNRCDADYDGDGLVGGPDFLRFYRAFGSVQGESAYDPALDADGDGVIGSAEFTLFRASFARLPGPSGLACAGAPPCP